MFEKFLAVIDWIVEALEVVQVGINVVFTVCIALLSFMFAALLVWFLVEFVVAAIC